MEYKKQNTQKVVKNHLQRTAKIQWEKILKEPRSDINKKWDFSYLLNLLWIGMLTGQINLRKIEDLSEDYYHARVSDTTLNNLIIRISPDPLRKELVKGVKKALHDHELPKDKFPIRITAIDGKCASISNQSVGEFSQKSTSNGKTYFINRVLRAMHVSNETKLILGQLEICGKTNEMGEYKQFLGQLVEDYKNTNLLETISVDAGMISKENADFTVSLGLDYIMALKSPQKQLVEVAKKLLGKRTIPDIKTEEKVNGKTIIRKLYRCSDIDYPGWPHLKEIWRIEQKTIAKDGKTSTDTRYFVTSLNPNKLSDKNVLKAIRMHWGIENNANWIFDTAWKEDDSPWSNYAFVFVTYLRMLAYNVLSRLITRRLRKENDRRRSWAGIMTLIFTVLVTTGFNNNIMEVNAIFV